MEYSFWRANKAQLFSKLDLSWLACRKMLSFFHIRCPKQILSLERSCCTEGWSNSLPMVWINDPAGHLVTFQSIYTLPLLNHTDH